MCIIAICDKKKLTDKELENCWTANSHGAGIGWYENNKVKYKKGFEKLADLKAYYETVTILPHVLHFRTGTSGGYGPEMTHPFIVDDNGSLDLVYEGDKSVLFHNGVISEWKDMAMTYFLSNGIRIPEGAWSDTRVLAVLCSRLGYPVLDFIYGKFVVIHANGIIIRYGAFTLDDGNYYSNTDYKDKVSYATGDGSFFRGSSLVLKDDAVESAEAFKVKYGHYYDKENYLSEEELEAIERMMGNPKTDKNKLITNLDNSFPEDWHKLCRWVVSRDMKITRRNGV